MSSITFRGSNGSLTTAPRKLLNFGGSRKKQEAVAKKITSTIAKHTKLPDASATKKRVASTTPSKFPVYTLATTTDADSSDVDALCSTLLQDSTHFEMLRYKDICARFKKTARTLLLPKPPRKLRYGAVFVSFAGALRIKCIESLGFDADGYERERAQEEAIVDAFHASLAASKKSSSDSSSDSSDSD